MEDFKKALEFWGPLFAAAEFARGLSDDTSYAGYSNGTMTLFISESRPRRVRRAAPTGKEFVIADHVGFSLARREDVDAMTAAMQAVGVKPLFPAQEYPEFGPGFYAVTFCDPDNNVIEFAHRTIPAATRVPKPE